MTSAMPETTPVTEMGIEPLEAESIARLFHETYERLAPQFSYETRKASAVSWEQVPENNRKLMIAVAATVLAALSTRAPEAAQVEILREALIEAEPLVETLHSLTMAKDARAIVWRALKRIRAALAQVRHPLEKEG